MEALTLRQRRERAIGDLQAVFEEIYGPRCPCHEAGCTCCTAWLVFDMIGKWTDSTLVDLCEDDDGAV